MGERERLKRVSKHDIPVLTPQFLKGLGGGGQPCGLRNAPSLGCMEGNAEAAGETFWSVARGGNVVVKAKSPPWPLSLSLIARDVVFRLSKLNWTMLAMLNIAKPK